MELVVEVWRLDAWATVLDRKVEAVALKMPQRPTSPWWAGAEACQAEARRRGTTFYLVWDWWVRQSEEAGALKTLAAIARVAPEALVLRDLGLLKAARQQYPDLKLHAAGGWGCHNSLGLRQAEALGFSRVVVAAPLGLKELALMRRQSSLPLEVGLTPPCPGFTGLCMLQDYLGANCDSCGAFLRRSRSPAATLFQTLEKLVGLAQLGVEAVQLTGEFFPEEALGQVVDLCQAVKEGAPEARLQALAAARQVLRVIEPGMDAVLPGFKKEGGRELPKVPAAKSGIAKAQRPLAMLPEGHLWIEARSFGEVADLARQGRHPLIVQLTPENYSDFLAQHRRWALWRLIRESSLAFYQKAMETLKQGGYLRFVVSDWGAVALVRQMGGKAYGDQTLGVRNSQALQMARQAGVARVCLPGGRPADWRDLMENVPKGSLWVYRIRFSGHKFFLSRQGRVLS